MSAPRFCALILLAVEAAAFWLVSRHYPLTVALLGGTVLALLWPGRLHLGTRTAAVAIGLAALAAGLPYWLGLYPPRPVALPFIGTLLFLGDLAAAVQVGLLLQKPRAADRAGITRPAEFLLLGIAALTGAGGINASAETHWTFGVLSGLFVCAAVPFVLLVERGASQRTPSRLFLALNLLLLALATGLGWAGSVFIARHGNDIDRLIAQGLANTSPLTQLGFSRNASLDSISRVRALDDVVALRIYSEAPPGYLRACVYDTYAKGKWSSTAAEGAAAMLTVQEAGLPLRTQRSVFRLSPLSPEPVWRMDMWHHEAVSTSCFLPVGTEYVVAAASQVLVDEYGAARPEQLDVDQPVTIFGGENAFLPGDLPHRETLLALPDTLDARVATLASEIGADATDVKTQAAAVEQYFLANYEYELGIQLPPEGEPLNYFLLQRPAAHCEFFAAGALVLLRLLGVPCRYVTGFVALEGDPLDGAWLARNKDAHAWVEAYDPETGWFVVEATPPAGVPQAEQRPLWRYAATYAGQQLREFRAFVRERLASLYLPIYTGTAVGAVIVCLAMPLLLALRRRRSTRNRGNFRPASPQTVALQRRLRHQDRLLRRRGFTRGPSETLHAFADRLERDEPELKGEAAWYRDYAAVRYGSKRPGE